MGGVQFSKATDGPIKRIAFWEIALRRKRGCKVSSRMWDRKKQAAKITSRTRGMTEESMLEELRQAKKDYRKAKKDHHEERLKFLETLSPKDRDRLKRTEEARRKGRLARKLNGKLSDSRVLRVQVGNEMRTDKPSIDQAFLTTNHSKMHSSENTSFMQEPLTSHFGYRAKTPARDQVTNGTFQPPPGTDPHAAELIVGLKAPAISTGNKPKFTPRRGISTEDHVRAWKKAKEKTAGGKSGLHFGMFKAHIKRSHLAEMDASMRSIAYSTGFSYHGRWVWTFS